MAKTAHGTLTGGTATALTLAAGAHIRGFRIKHRGTSADADIWVTWGYNTTTTASASLAGSYNLVAGETLIEDDANWLSVAAPPEWTGTAFSLFSTGSVAYSVETW